MKSAYEWTIGKANTAIAERTFPIPLNLNGSKGSGIFCPIKFKIPLAEGTGWLAYYTWCRWRGSLDLFTRPAVFEWYVCRLVTR